MRRSLGLCAFLSLGCGTLDFQVGVKGRATIPGGGSPLPGIIELLPLGLDGFGTIDFDRTEEFRNRGVTKDKVESATLSSMRLSITGPDDQDFSFLKSIRFVARAGQQESLLGEKNGVDELPLDPPRPSFLVDTTDAELKSYIAAPSMQIEVSGSGSAPDRETDLEALVTLEVSARL